MTKEQLNEALKVISQIVEIFEKKCQAPPVKYEKPLWKAK
jgi:hypothetical protein